MALFGAKKKVEVRGAKKDLGGWRQKIWGSQKCFVSEKGKKIRKFKSDRSNGRFEPKTEDF
jgi:hypothetical protein